MLHSAWKKYKGIVKEYEERRQHRLLNATSQFWNKEPANSMIIEEDKKVEKTRMEEDNKSQQSGRKSKGNSRSGFLKGKKRGGGGVKPIRENGDHVVGEAGAGREAEEEEEEAIGRTQTSMRKAILGQQWSREFVGFFPIIFADLLGLIKTRVIFATYLGFATNHSQIPSNYGNPSPYELSIDSEDANNADSTKIESFGARDFHPNDNNNNNVNSPDLVALIGATLTVSGILIGALLVYLWNRWRRVSTFHPDSKPETKSQPKSTFLSPLETSTFISLSSQRQGKTLSSSSSPSPSSSVSEKILSALATVFALDSIVIAGVSMICIGLSISDHFPLQSPVVGVLNQLDAGGLLSNHSDQSENGIDGLYFLGNKIQSNNDDTVVLGAIFDDEDLVTGPSAPSYVVSSPKSSFIFENGSDGENSGRSETLPSFWDEWTTVSICLAVCRGIEALIDGVRKLLLFAFICGEVKKIAVILGLRSFLQALTIEIGLTFLIKFVSLENSQVRILLPVLGCLCSIVGFSLTLLQKRLQARRILWLGRTFPVKT